MPNAGMPRAVEGRNIYLCSPEYMASFARKAIKAGAQFVWRLLRHHAEPYSRDEVGDSGNRCAEPQSESRSVSSESEFRFRKAILRY
jgi:hypothetical protein